MNTYHGKPCKHGHTLRWRSDRSCVECRRDYTRRMMERLRRDHKYRYGEQLRNRRRMALERREARHGSIPDEG